jgi:hypothetical protein
MEIFSGDIANKGYLGKRPDDFRKFFGTYILDLFNGYFPGKRTCSATREGCWLI